MRKSPIAPVTRGIGRALSAAALVLLAASTASAGVQNLTSATDNSTDTTVPVTDLLMVTITSTAGTGGNDATATLVTIGGTVVPADVASISVYYQALLVTTVANPASLTDVSISLPGNQKGGQDWTYFLSLNGSAGGKTFNMTVTSITGTDDGVLPFTTATRNAIGNTAPAVTITSPADASNFDEGVTVDFAGTATDAEDGTLTTSLSWTSDLDGTIGSGGSFTLSTLSVGLHTITASVTDSGSLTGQAQITVTINNVAPTVTITQPAVDPNVTQGTSVTFAATATDPNDGDISAGLAWTSNLDGAIGSGATFATTALSVGVHTITATVTDPDNGAVTGQDQVTVTVNPPGNTAPTVTITSPIDASNFDEGVAVDFAGTATDTEDGTLTASLSWTSDLDGTIGSGGSFTLSNLSVGVHTITASVTDSGSLTGQDLVKVTINNVAPTVTITQPAVDPNVTQGTSVTFAANATDPNDGDISAGLTWTSNLDGTIGSGATFATTTLSVGVHTITATVTDPDNGAVAGQDQVTVTVNAPVANDITVNPPTATVDSCNQITITATFTGDADNDSTAAFESSATGGNPWSTVPGCSVVAGASPKTCVHTVPDNSVYYYRVSWTDLDGVNGTNPSNAIGPYDTSIYCAVTTTTINANAAEATTCSLITTTSLFAGDEDGDGSLEVQYNTTNSFPATIACAAVGGGSPRQCRIPGLTANQDYYLRFHFSDPDGVVAGGAANDEVIGPVNTGTCLGDGVAPMILVLAPSRNAIIGGVDRVKVQVFDAPIGGVGVLWSVDGGATTAAGQNANYDCGTDCAVFEFDLDTTSAGLNLGNGAHYFTIEATDGDGQTTRLGQAFRVNNSGDKAAGNGLLLRRTHGSQLCRDCHNLKTHSSQNTSSKYGDWAIDCTTCHTPHLTTNIYLIRGTIDTPNSGSRSVRFETTVGAVANSSTPGTASYVNEDNASQADGICQACHTRTKNAAGDARWRNADSGGNADTHFTSAATSRCTGCHTHEGGFSGAGGACDSCHDAPPPNTDDGPHEAHYALSFGIPGGYGEVTPKTTATDYGFNCGKCHSGTHINDSTSAGDAVDPYDVEIFFDATTNPMNPSGSYTPATQSADQGPDGRYWGWSVGTCSNLYCHSNAAPVGAGAVNDPKDMTWDKTVTVTCTSCHNTQGRTDSGVATDLSTAHGKHIQSTSGETGTYSFKCDRCHAATIVGAPNDPWNLADADLADKRQHVNGVKDVVITSALDGDADGTNNYSASTCSDTYCHSQGTTATPPFLAANTALAWDTGTSTCISCHDWDATQAAADTMSTGKHENHVDNAAVIGDNYECATCHAATVSAGDNGTITGFANHVNGVKNISGPFVDATYSSPTCTASYCHSSGQNAAGGSSFEYYTTPDWFTATVDALDCKGCHGRHSTATVSSSFGEPDYPNGGAGAANANSHDRHVFAAADCAKCHNATTATGTSILPGAPHTDGNRDVVIAAAYDTGDPNYDSATKTCQNIACHGTGSPQWGSTLTCLACHGGPDGGTLGDGTPNGVGDEWLTDGHGSAAGGSLNSALGGCDYCHQLDAAHTPTAASNPYRLRFAQTDNTLCLQCHGGGADGTLDSGISQNSAGTALTPVDSSLDVDTAHFGDKHEGTEGGKLCWDCHDPHGVPSNIVMIKSLVSKNATAYGVPGTTVTVNFTNNTTPGPAVGHFVEQTNTPRTGICQACHDPSGQGSSGATNYWHSDGSNETHNSDKVCTDCHFHTANFKGSGGDCLGCHGASGGAGTTGSHSRRPVQGDFGKNSHHVGASVDKDGNALYTQPNMGGALTNFDCVVCHAEGKVVEDPPGSGTFVTDTAGQPHADGFINLRNTDDTTAYYTYDKDSIEPAPIASPGTWMSGNSAWETQTLQLDRFCLSCHDADGASATFNSGANEGLGFSGSATNPFADSDITNEYDEQSRGAVVNIRNKVDAYVDDANNPITPQDRDDAAGGVRTNDGRADPTQGIFSRHAVGGDGSTWGASSVYGTSQIPSARFVTRASDSLKWNDTSVMSCADCHTTDGANSTNGNAHGSNTEYLLKNADGLATSEPGYTGTATDNFICFKCHSGANYYEGDSHTGNASDFVFTADLDQSSNDRRGGNGNIFGLPCMNCHGGAPSFGGIHGNSERFDIATGWQCSDSGDWCDPADTRGCSRNPQFCTVQVQREGYRFMSGASLRFYDPGDWNASAVTCYTLANPDSFGGCTQHTPPGGGKPFTRPVTRNIQY